MSFYLMPFDREDAEAISVMLEDKLRLHLAAKYLARRVTSSGSATADTTQEAGNPVPEKPALSTSDTCPNCGTGELGDESDRIELRWDDPVVKPCRACRPAEFAAFCARRAAAEAADPDPWDLSQEEQVAGAIKLTARELCDGESGRGSGCPSLKGDRAGYDERDDTSDIEAHERTTSYPWGPR